MEETIAAQQNIINALQAERQWLEEDIIQRAAVKDLQQTVYDLQAALNQTTEAHNALQIGRRQVS